MTFRCIAAFALFSLVPSVALANGRYPTAKQLVLDPNDPKHLAVTTTFGVLESRDEGRSFAWRCESALGTSGDQDQLIAISASGALVAALSNGIVATSDGCSFHSAPEVAGKYVADLALSRGAPHELFAFRADLADNGQIDSQILRSTDDGQTWSPVGPPLPGNVLPLSIDVAPSMPDRVYLSARLGSADSYASVLMRSDDRGKTFQSTPIPETLDMREAFIAAVHPTNPDRLFLRVDDSPETIIWSTVDGGATLQKRFTGTGQLLGFAMSPDGSQIAFGGPADGVWTGAEDATTFVHRSSVGPTCLAWTQGTLYACADQAIDPFSIGRSKDGATTFETLLRFDAFCGATACAADSKAAMACALDWQSIAPTLGAVCRMDAGVSGPSEGGAPLDASVDARRSDANGEPVDVTPPPPPSSGGSNVSPRTERGSRWEIIALLGALACFHSRAKRRG